MKPLTTPEKAFVSAYLTDLNGTKAYMKIRPETSHMTAKTLASRMLSKVHIKEYIDSKLEKRESLNGHTKDKIIERYDGLITKAENKGQIQTAINGVTKIAEIKGHFNDGERS